MTAEQETSALHAQLWLTIACEEDDPDAKEAYVEMAIKNLMIASYAR